MKRLLLKALILCFPLLIYACATPCETQSFYFGKDTITFPIDVQSILQRYQGDTLDTRYIKSGVLSSSRGDTALSLRFSLYTDHRFAPDGDDGHIKNAKGYEVTDTLGKGIYSYCFYLPDIAYDSTLRYLESKYGDKYQKKTTIDSPRYDYYVWELSDCTKLVFSSVKNPTSEEAFAAGEKVTFVEFVHRLDERELDLSVHYGGFKGKPFD